jgi:hypothetical protein
LQHLYSYKKPPFQRKSFKKHTPLKILYPDMGKTVNARPRAKKRGGYAKGAPWDLLKYRL